MKDKLGWIRLGGKLWPIQNTDLSLKNNLTPTRPAPHPREALTPIPTDLPLQRSLNHPYNTDLALQNSLTPPNLPSKTA